MYLLEVEPLDLGTDVRAIGLELVEGDEREPLRGAEAARIWARVLSAVAAADPWVLDFFSHLDRVREYCSRHGIAFREAGRCLVIEPPPDALLEELLHRFEGELFGARAGDALPSSDPQLEGELARRGVDGYHHTFGNYAFCAVCDFSSGFLTLLSNRLWASEVIRRVTPLLRDLQVEAVLPQ
jgi:hypothetical protein